MKCHKEATLNEPKTSPTIYAIYMVYIYIYMIPARRARNQRRRARGRELSRLKHSPCRSVNTEASFLLSLGAMSRAPGPLTRAEER